VHFICGFSLDSLTSLTNARLAFLLQGSRESFLIPFSRVLYHRSEKWAGDSISPAGQSVLIYPVRLLACPNFNSKVSLLLVYCYFLISASLLSTPHHQASSLSGLSSFPIFLAAFLSSYARCTSSSSPVLRFVVQYQHRPLLCWSHFPFI